jgi:hypothetical protein
MFARCAAALAGLMLVGCTHSPETVVHLTAPSSAHWTVRDAKGAPLCALPCTVELDTDESVVVAREGGTQFVVQQEHLGAGAWTGDVRLREEPTAAALALGAFSGALATAGATLIDTRRQDRLAAGVVLAGLGTAGVLASTAWPGTKREELWLQRTAKAAP